jgi:hypothetical protein
MQKKKLFAIANFWNSGLAAHFKCPLIVISPVGSMKAVNDFVGNPTSVAATPHLFLNYKEPMTFMQRVKNFFVITMEWVMMMRMSSKSETFYK